MGCQNFFWRKTFGATPRIDPISIYLVSLSKEILDTSHRSHQQLMKLSLKKIFSCPKIAFHLTQWQWNRSSKGLLRSRIVIMSAILRICRVKYIKIHNK
jgi:hypothetical protein